MIEDSIAGAKNCKVFAVIRICSVLVATRSLAIQRKQVIGFLDRQAEGQMPSVTIILGISRLSSQPEATGVQDLAMHAVHFK